MTIKLIVGLANPSLKYALTRHNAGAWYVNLLAKKLCSPLLEEIKFIGRTSHTQFVGTDIHLLIPSTFMNLNGEAVAMISAFYCISPNEILVAHDDLDLPPGIARFKLNGSYNSHNGLKNIITKLGNNPNFYRLRIGIGHPGNKNKVINFLLSKPSDSERKLINKAIEEAAYCTEIWFQEGLIKAINRLHNFKAQ